jgi:alpha-D-ribose 1-methylphosphonate 5-triphosphate diphosphatase
MWLSELKIVLPDRVIERGALRLRGGKITAILEGEAPAESLYAGGLTAIPGIVDLHGDMLERDIEPRPNAFFPYGLGIYELDKRLVATGITTAYAAISFAFKKTELRRRENAVAIIEEINAQVGCLLSDLRVHARFEINNPEMIKVLTALLRENKLHLVSLMDHTPGQGQYGDIDRYVSFMHRWMGVDEDAVGAQVVERLKTTIAEEEAVPRNWELAREMVDLALQSGVPVASHDDDTAEKVNRMAELGVSISEFPVTMEAAETARTHGMHVLMGAPNAYRDQSTSNNLRAMDGIRSGMVDSLATDYFPAAPLQAAFRIAQDGVLPLHEAINLITRNPANAVGLKDRGRVEVGAAADVVLVAEDNDYPRVHATFRNGEPVYWDVFMARLTDSPLLHLMEQDA